MRRDAIDAVTSSDDSRRDDEPIRTRGKRSRHAAAVNSAGTPNISCRSKRTVSSTPARSCAELSEESSVESDTFDPQNDGQNESDDGNDGDADDGEEEDRLIGQILAVRRTDCIEEYLLRWKGMPFCKVEWISSAKISEMDRGLQMMSMFNRKLESYKLDPEYYNDPPQYFNPRYLIPERVVAANLEEELYLVKWTDLDYTFNTWESPSPTNLQPLIDECIERQRISSLFKRKSSAHRPSTYDHLKESPVYKEGNTLRDYQLEGLNWISFSWHQRRNGILADEMGLGKTVQSVAFVDYLVKSKLRRGPFLVVAPLSTLPHWQREFRSWTSLNSIVYYGSGECRKLIRHWEFYTGKSNSHVKFQVLITSYETLMNDARELVNIFWDSLIVDEAHRLKNDDSRLFQELQNFNVDHRLLLTGTPLQNNVRELWCLLYFLHPELFDDWDAFEKKFGTLSESNAVDELREAIKPFMLRRMKCDVAKNILRKEETVIEVELTSKQKMYYKAVYERNLLALKPHTKSCSVPSLMNIAMQLRKICNHPWTLKGAEEADCASESLAPSSIPSIIRKLIDASGKMILLDKLLPRLKEQGHRVLIFSQFVRILDILEDYLRFCDHSLERIDGSVKGIHRQQAIDRFSDPKSDSFVFLLCTKAGGLGINLTAADTVIIYDSDWNPQNDLQAQARCHRIGQTQVVKVYRLITRGTYEHHMFHRSSLKLGMDRAVLHSMNQNISSESSLSSKEIESLLKHGAYEVFKDDDESKANAFCSESIDRILERSANITYSDDLEKGSIFSKASFIDSNTEGGLSMDDPNFWSKVGIVEVQDVAGSKLAPRRRTCVKSYAIKSDIRREKDMDSGSDFNDKDCDDENSSRSIRHELVSVSCEDVNFFHLLSSFGYSRWDEIRAGGVNLDAESMQELTRCIILYATVSQNLNSNECETLRRQHPVAGFICRDLHAEECRDDERNILCKNNPSSIQLSDQLKKLLSLPTNSLKNIFSRLDQLFQLKMLMERVNKMTTTCQKDELFSLLHNEIRSDCINNKLPVDWWVPSIHDPCLAQGVYDKGLAAIRDLGTDCSAFPWPSHLRNWPSVTILKARFRSICSHLSRRSCKQSLNRGPKKIIANPKPDVHSFSIPSMIRALFKWTAAPVLSVVSLTDWDDAELQTLVEALQRMSVDLDVNSDKWRTFIELVAIPLKSENQIFQMATEIVSRAQESQTILPTEKAEQELFKFCRKVCHRITFLQECRVALEQWPESNDVFKSASSGSLPVWWKLGKSDRVLFESVLYDGFGNWKRLQEHQLIMAGDCNWIVPSDQTLESRLKTICRLISKLAGAKSSKKDVFKPEPVTSHSKSVASSSSKSTDSQKKFLNQSKISAFFRAKPYPESWGVN